MATVDAAPDSSYGEVVKWEPASPRFRPDHLVLHWVVATIAVFAAAWVMPHVSVQTFPHAAVAAALIAALNAVLPPLVAALRLPFTPPLGFVAALVLDPLILLLASQIDPHSFEVDGFGWALLASLVIAVVSLVLEVIVGVDNDDVYALRVIARVARRQ